MTNQQSLLEEMWESVLWEDIADPPHGSDAARNFAQLAVEAARLEINEALSNGAQKGIRILEFEALAVRKIIEELKR